MQCFAGGIEALKNRVPNYTHDSHFESFRLCGNMPLLRFLPLADAIIMAKNTTQFFFTLLTAEPLKPRGHRAWPSWPVP